ncbi:glycosyltransferase family 2 protein [Microbacterium sp. NPDC077184]|uniref:glycosyltransferase family 2 protein n=1 Tax=Microbacterium sp. NPDC077184 TaxID=3154764 RepID=UPI0034400862
MSAASIVIPAHDEGAGIAARLRRMLAGTDDGEFEIVVVANGCHDDTARQAASVPGVRVVEIAPASKIAALNAGDEAAGAFPRLYLDADIEIDAETLRALVRLLAAAEEPCAAAPTLQVDASRSSWAMRHYVRVWELSDYRRAGHVGSGVYAVNAAGRRRWDRFPDVIADDRFVQQQFDPSERRTSSGTFTVRAPATMRAHLRRATRIDLGNRELGAVAQRAAPVPARVRYARLLSRVARRPDLWIALPIYVYGYAVPMLRARRALRRGQHVPWARDASVRDEVAA